MTSKNLSFTLPRQLAGCPRFASAFGALTWGFTVLGPGAPPSFAHFAKRVGSLTSRTAPQPLSFRTRSLGESLP